MQVQAEAQVLLFHAKPTSDQVKAAAAGKPLIMVRGGIHLILRLTFTPKPWTMLTYVRINNLII